MRRHLPDLLALLLLLAAVPLWLGLAYGGHRSAAFSVEALPVMLPTSGLLEPEPLVDRPGTFRWTDGAGVLRPPNPGGPLYLRLSLSSGLDTATPLELVAGEARHSFTVLPGLREYGLLLPAQPGERVRIELRSPTVEIDGRRLGVVVSRLFVAGDGPAPPLLLGAMLLATAGAYGLLRRAGLGLFAAMAGVLALQAGVAAWQWAGAWRYGFLGGLLALGGAAALGALVIERIWPPLPPAPATPVTYTGRDGLALAGLLTLALALCLPWLGAPDPVGDLELSARRMGFMARGGFAEAFTFGGDYMPFRLFILRLLAPLVPMLGGVYYEPLPAVTRAIIKLPSLGALLLTVALLFRWTRAYGGTGRAALIAGLYAVAPPVWMNAAWWGQVDVLLSLPMVAAVALLDRWRGRISWLCWAAGLMIKPQAIILAPLLYGATLRRYGPRGLLEGGLAALALIAAACGPFVLIGQGPGLYQAAVGSVGRFPQVTNRAYNLWWLVAGDRPVSDLTEWAGISYRSLGFLLVGAAALVATLAVLRRPDGPTRALAAAALALAFFALPTQIHERYAFFALPFLLLAAAADPRLLLPYALVVVTGTLNILGAIRGFAPDLHRAIRASALPETVAWLSLATLAGLLLALLFAPRGRPGDQETRRPGDQETRRPGDQETRRPGDQETRRPLLLIWLRPRAAFRAALAGRPPWEPWLLAALAGVSAALAWGAWSGLVGATGSWALLAIAVAVGPPLGAAALLLAGVLLRTGGRPLGGRAGAGQVRTALAWALAPAIAGLPLSLAQLALPPPVGSGAGAGPAQGLLASGLWTVQAVLWSWSAALSVISLAEAHGLPLWRAGLSWLVGGLAALAGAALLLGGAAIVIGLRGG